MITCATLGDKNYVGKGLAMHKSLMDTIEGDFILHWLCLDAESYWWLDKIQLPNVHLYLLKDFEENDPELLAAKENPACQYGTQWSQYAWTLCPYWIESILANCVPPGEKLLYIDSDIEFYVSPQIILDVVGDKSLGVHTHRFEGKFHENSPVGFFNIGIVCFTNNEIGRKMSEQWKQWLLKTNHEYYASHGGCGDQRYMDLAYKIIGWENICIFDDDTIISHYAPWATVQEPNKKVCWMHFSHFCIKDGKWQDYQNETPEWRPSLNHHILPLYENYFTTIKTLCEQYNLPLC